MRLWLDLWVQLLEFSYHYYGNFDAITVFWFLFYVSCWIMYYYDFRVGIVKIVKYQFRMLNVDEKLNCCLCFCSLFIRRKFDFSVSKEQAQSYNVVNRDNTNFRVPPRGNAMRQFERTNWTRYGDLNERTISKPLHTKQFSLYTDVNMLSLVIALYYNVFDFTLRNW